MYVARITIVTDAKIAATKAIRTIHGCDLFTAKNMVVEGFYVRSENYAHFIESWADIENSFRADVPCDCTLSINIAMVEITMPLMW